MENNKKKSIKKIIIIILSITVVLLVSTYFILKNQEKNIANLESQVKYLKEEFIPMEFEISNNTDDKIKLKAVFYNLDGTKVGSQTVKINGEELNIDLKVIDFSEENFLFFPYCIYTNKMPAKDSIKIFDSYNKKDFPAIYEGITELEGGEELTEESRENIKRDLIEKFNLVITGVNEFSDDSHGVSLHDIKEVSKFKKGFVYKVVCHPHTGAVEIVLK